MKRYITSSELHAWSLDLAMRIDKSGWKPDVVIGLYRGGVYPAIVIEDYLRSKGVKADHFPLRTSSYDPDKAESSNAEGQHNVFIDDLPKDTRLLNWNRILIVDDICDTGETFCALADKFSRIANSYGTDYVLDVRRAVIAWKPRKYALIKPRIKPDWWVKEYESDDWIVFPHEFAGLKPEELEEKMQIERSKR